MDYLQKLEKENLYRHSTLCRVSIADTFKFGNSAKSTDRKGMVNAKNRTVF